MTAARRLGAVALALVAGGVACATSSDADTSDTSKADSGAALPDGGDSATSDAPPSLDGAKRVFATKEQHSGNLGGLSGADAICQTAADGAGLGGTWKAWLSEGATDAASRIGSAKEWRLVDGVTVVFPGSPSGVAAHDIDMDESGATGDKGLAWTGTSASGSATGKDCNGWTSAGASGTAGYVGEPTKWTDDGTETPCNLNGRLYCFEQ